MKNFLSKKSIGAFLFLGAGLLALVMAIVYSIFSAQYGIMNVSVTICLIIACVISIVLFLFDTPVDSYLEIAFSVLVSVGLCLFLVDSVGDFTDAISQIHMFGSGAPVDTIIVIDVFIGISLLCSFIGAGCKKSKVE